MVNLQIIKDLCKQSGVTLKKLAAEIGMTDSGLVRSIQNNATTSKYIDRIANYFGVSAGIFFGDTKAEGFEILRKIYENQDKINKLQAETNQLLIKLYNK